MRGLAITACGILTLALSACGDADDDAENVNATTNGASAEAIAGDSGGSGNSGASTTSGWPEGSRIVEEAGVTYRVERTGTRVALGPNDSRIVVADGIRYRVDPDGTRVRIDATGSAVRIGDSVITGNAPNGRSNVETPGETVTDAAEDTVEAVGDAIPD